MSSSKKARAGLIPYIVNDEGLIEMMFMKPSDPKYGGEDFQIAKGLIDPEDEDELAAAVREAKEELGFFTGNVEGDFIEVGNFVNNIALFACKVKDKDLFGEPHFETGEVTWMTEQQFCEDGRKLHVPAIKATIRKIEKITK